MKTVFVIATILLLRFGTACAQSTEPWPVVESLNPLLAQAWANGHAHGILGGPFAAKTRSEGNTQPIKVTVKVVALLKQTGCKRLAINIMQRGVILPGSAKPQNRHAELSMAYCAGGALPATKEGAQVIEGAK